MECQLANYYTKNGLERAIDIYNFPKDYSYRTRTIAIRYLFLYRNNYRKSPSVFQIEKQSSELFSSLLYNRNEASILLELMDIMLEHSPTKGNEMLQQIRQRDIIPVQIKKKNIHDVFLLKLEITNKKIKNTVYGDNQNVHNTKINKTVKICAQEIYRLALIHGPLPNWDIIRKQVDKLFPGNDTVLDRINRDVATYNIDLNLVTIFLSVWVWINHHEHKQELLLRLKQEFLEMDGYCSTGFLSRLLNIIQGFSDNEKLQILISDKDQCSSVIKSYINKLLQEYPNMLDSMIDQKQDFVDFITIKINEKKDEWEHEYGTEFIQHIHEVVNKHTLINIFL
jgi:hypothetical protein